MTTGESLKFAGDEKQISREIYMGNPCDVTVSRDHSDIFSNITAISNVMWVLCLYIPLCFRGFSAIFFTSKNMFCAPKKHDVEVYELSLNKASVFLYIYYYIFFKICFTVEVLQPPPQMQYIAKRLAHVHH